MLRRLDVPYLALNPGASYRALHDSLVNHIGNRAPAMLLCRHEESAVAGINFTGCGQSCAATSRLCLHESIHDRAVAGVLAAVRCYPPGPPAATSSRASAARSAPTSC